MDVELWTTNSAVYEHKNCTWWCRNCATGQENTKWISLLFEVAYIKESNEWLPIVWEVCIIRVQLELSAPNLETYTPWHDLGMHWPWCQKVQLSNFIFTICIGSMALPVWELHVDSTAIVLVYFWLYSMQQLQNSWRNWIIGNNKLALLVYCK